MTEYTISELAENTGVNRRTIHFYVQQGLLPPPEGAGLAARYGDEHLLRLRAIPLLRNTGLRLDDIRARLDGLDVPALEKLIVAPAPAPPVKEMPPPGRPGPTPHPQTLIRYHLAPGVELLVDVSAHPNVRTWVEALLRGAPRGLATQSDSQSSDHNGGNR